MTKPDFPVFDADNHLYESPTWLEYLTAATPATSSSSRSTAALASR